MAEEGLDLRTRHPSTHDFLIVLDGGTLEIRDEILNHFKMVCDWHIAPIPFPLLDETHQCSVRPTREMTLSDMEALVRGILETHPLSVEITEFWVATVCPDEEA